MSGPNHSLLHEVQKFSPEAQSSEGPPPPSPSLSSSSSSATNEMEIIFDSRTVLACNTQLTDGLDLLDAAGVFLIKSIEPAMTLATAKHCPEEKKMWMYDI